MGSKKVVSSSLSDVNSKTKLELFNSVTISVHLDSHKVKVILGTGQTRLYRGHCRVFCNRNHTPSQVESLLVCPLHQSISVFKANNQSTRARSYADVVQIVPPCDKPYKSQTTHKARVFHARKSNNDTDNNSKECKAEQSVEVTHCDNKKWVNCHGKLLAFNNARQWQMNKLIQLA